MRKGTFHRVSYIIISFGLLFFFASRKHSRPAVDWNSYRIGDGIAWHLDAPGCSDFPDSLVCAYRNQTEVANDVAVLAEVIGSFTTHIPKPQIDEVVLHLRLGDGLCYKNDRKCVGVGEDVDCWERDSDCWIDKAIDRQYAFSKHWYPSVAKELLPNSRIIIVSDQLHWTRTLPDPRNGDFSIDIKYRNKVANFFMLLGHSVQFKDTGTPDEDFVFMVAAHTFVSSGGGLSILVGRVVEYQGGTVLVPVNEHTKTEVAPRTTFQSFFEGFRYPKTR